ncbi:MAG: hypothetical protein HC933_04505 [Pleurocapsa sp. SU_196_0]|nr:hypothetical protein [Pleurocapsa sp. SU_196_0]
MRRILSLFLVVALFASSGSSQNTGITNERMTVAQFSDRLIRTPRNNLRLTIIAANLNPALQTTVNALAHGWCENPVLFWCGAIHFPIPMRVLTGENVASWWLQAAQLVYDQIPGALTQRRAEVILLKTTPSRTVWLLEDAKDGDWLVTGRGLDTYLADDITVIKAPGLATAMLKQLFVDQVIQTGRRWEP